MNVVPVQLLSRTPNGFAELAHVTSLSLLTKLRLKANTLISPHELYCFKFNQGGGVKVIEFFSCRQSIITKMYYHDQKLNNQ